MSAHTSHTRRSVVGPDGLTENQRDYLARRRRLAEREDRLNGTGEVERFGVPDGYAIGARCLAIRQEWGFKLPEDATPEDERAARRMLLRAGERYKSPTKLGHEQGGPKGSKFVPGLESIRKTSKYIGVYRLASTIQVRWLASVYHDGKSRHIGRFSTEEAAARAYDAAARRLKGPGARLNFPDEG